ncbi:MAG: histidine phosphatase family protein [Acidimicrobiales bacterium]
MPCTPRRSSAPARRRPHRRALGQRVRIDKGLLECEFGEWTGRKLAELNKLPEWQTVQRYPSGFRFPGGESFSEMQQRMVSAIDRLGAAHRGKAVVLVSHADPIKAAVAHALGTHLDLFQRIVVSPCSVTAILQTPTGPVVLAVNSTGDDLATLVPS